MFKGFEVFLGSKKRFLLWKCSFFLSFSYGNVSIMDIVLFCFFSFSHHYNIRNHMVLDHKLQPQVPICGSFLFANVQLNFTYLAANVLLMQHAVINLETHSTK